MNEINLHKQQITAMVVDQSRNLVITAGNDKRIKIVDLDTMQVKGTLKTANCRFGCLAINEELQRIYAGS